MATITSAQSGNFNNTATWVGGVVPVAGDIAVAATGHIVDINVNTTVASITQAGTGRFRIGNGITLTGDVTINAGTISTFGTLECTATTTSTVVGNISGASGVLAFQVGVFMSGSGKLIINGNVTGTAGNNTFSNDGAAVYTNVASCQIEINGNVTAGGLHKQGVYVNNASSSATITIIGNVTSGTGSGVHGVISNATASVINVTGQIIGISNGVALITSGNANIIGNITCTNQDGGGITSNGASGVVSVTGNVTGGTLGSNCFGIRSNGASGVVSVTGNVTGGTGNGNSGISSTAASTTITVIGNVTSSSTSAGITATGASSFVDISGTATAVNFQHAVESSATSSGFGVRFSGTITDSPGGRVAIYTRFFRMVSNNTGITQYANSAGFPTGGYLNRVAPANVTGMPSANNVRSPLVYGFNNELTGTLVVPAANTVTLGVSFDNGTLGTAQNTASSFITELSASSDPLAVRLQNVATVQTTGDQIAAASPS
jgi:hypothetical protein